MAGHKPFSKLAAKMSPPRRARANERTRTMLAEMVLAELRQQSGKTQKELATALGITQPSLSKMESRHDMQISTLDRLIRSLGGSLELIAHLPGGDVRLTQFDQG